MRVDVICLANSRNRGGRCVAGLRADGGGWVRPVSPARDGVLYAAWYTLADGSEARPLDLVEMTLREPRPEPHQPENWLLAGVTWRLRARPAPRSVIAPLRAALERGPTVLGTREDRVPVADLPVRASLALAAPVGVRWRVATDGSGLRRLRAMFALRHQEYDLPVTDPEWEQRAATLPDGCHHGAALGEDASGRLLLTLSLGKPFGETACCHKLVAAVITVPADWSADGPAPERAARAD